MRFMCARTSNYSDETIRPCEEATLAPFRRVDRRRFALPDETLRRTGWYDAGKNHRVENDMIARDFEEERWFVHLSSLEDLHAFIAAHHGQVVIELRNDSTEPYLVLEIYDTHRE